MHSTLRLLKEFRGQNLQNFVPSALAYAFGRRPNFLNWKLRLRPKAKILASVIHWSEQPFSYCLRLMRPKDVLTYDPPCHRRTPLFWPQRKNFKGKRKKRIPPPDPPRHLYLFEVQLIYPPLMWKFPGCPLDTIGYFYAKMSHEYIAAFKDEFRGEREIWKWYKRGGMVS